MAIAKCKPLHQIARSGQQSSILGVITRHALVVHNIAYSRQRLINVNLEALLEDRRLNPQIL
jgi:hypothetical protein